MGRLLAHVWSLLVHLNRRFRADGTPAELMPFGVPGSERLGIVHGIEEFTVRKHFRPDAVLEHIAQQFGKHTMDERMDGSTFLVKMDGDLNLGFGFLRYGCGGKAHLQRQGGKAAK